MLAIEEKFYKSNRGLQLGMDVMLLEIEKVQAKTLPAIKKNG